MKLTLDDAYYAALDMLIRPRAASTLPDSLKPVQMLLAALGVQQPPFPIAVVAGSTGKGTTALRLAAGLAEGGLRVGLYTSPHLHSFRERFALIDPASRTQSPRVEGQPAVPERISRAAFSVHARAVLEAAAALNLPFSTFESATALALRWFAEQAVDVAVCEIGLGGRFDAANAAAHELALIGPIEIEHAAMLGGSLERIAWHKAGVIAHGGAAIALRPADPRVRAIFEQEARDQGAQLTYADDLAQAGLAWFKERGLAGAGAAVPPDLTLPGRLERLSKGDQRVIIDGGHTPLAARRLAAAFAPDLLRGVRIIVGMLADKDAKAYLRELDLPGVTLVLTAAPAERARTAEALAAGFSARHARIELQPSFDAALAGVCSAPEPLIVAAGSLRVAAAAREALGLLDEDALDEARRTRALFAGPAYRARWDNAQR